MTQRKRTKVRVETDDGWRLAVEEQHPECAPLGVVVCGHAMMCDRRTLDRPNGGLGTALRDAGFIVWLCDLRGHGESGPRASRRTDISYDDYVLRDIPALVRAARATYPELPLAVVGHSLTGHAAAAAISQTPGLPVDALVSLGGNVWLPSLEPETWRWVVKRVLLEIFGLSGQLVGRVPVRGLRMGTDDEGATYARQFAMNARNDRWASADGTRDYLVGLQRLTLPVLSVAGAADRWLCHPDSARRWLARAISARVTYRAVGERPGDPADIDHMGLVLNPEMAPVWSEIGDWLRAALSGQA